MVPHERTGRPAPLVLAPEGVKPNIMVFDREGQFVYRIRKKDELPNFYAYISHFVDCPAASNFKRSKPNVTGPTSPNT